MPRRDTEMMDDAINTVAFIRERVEARYPNQDVSIEVDRAVHLYAAMRQADATNDLEETIRKWTP